MTAPATPTPLGWLLEAAYRYYDLGDDTGQSDGADRATRALVEAALALDAYRVEADAVGWPDWDARFEALEAAAAAYRAWAPSPDAARDGGGG